MNLSKLTIKSESKVTRLRPTEQSSETKAETAPPGRDAHGYWKPGQSGNPGGRPKRTPLTDVTREKLPQKIPDDPQGRTYAEAIVDKLIAMALCGDIAAIRELHDRAEGKSRQTIDIGNAALREAYERLTPEEAEAWLHDGKPPAWWTQGEMMDDEAAR